MEFQCKVRDAQNGWIVELNDGVEIVCQDTAEDEVGAMAQFLWMLLEHFGPMETTNKFAQKRIWIVTAPGHKHPDHDDRLYWDDYYAGHDPQPPEGAAYVSHERVAFDRDERPVAVLHWDGQWRPLCEERCDG